MTSNTITAIKKALEGVGPLKVEFTPDCEDFNSIIAPINSDYDGTFFTVIGRGGKQDKLGSYITLAVNELPDLLSEIDRLQRENALMQERTADYPTISAKIHDREKAREAEQRDCREAIARAEAAEAEVNRLQTELALSKPLYSRRQIEARVKLLEAALKPFAEIASGGFGSSLPDDAPLAIVNANMPDLPQWLQKVRGVVTQGDCRRARTALASTGGEHHAE